MELLATVSLSASLLSKVVASVGVEVNTGMNKGAVPVLSVVRMTINGNNALVLAAVVMTPPKTQEF